MRRETKSLCPECFAVIDTSIFEENGKVMLEKTCSRHGTIRDVYWSNAEQYKRFYRYWHDGEGVSNPNLLDGTCPGSCGLCPSHKTTTILANIDVTNRCNQRCPVCFANASSSGYIYEPPLEQIRKMMHMLRSEKPVPCPAVQFAGGEPTVRSDIAEIVRMARGFGFAQIQMATNGIRLAKSVELCRELKDAGLNTVYLQFDGVTEKPYQINRGYNALPLKLKAIENCRKSGLTSITLVPTLAKDVNDNEVGDIIRFAVDNMDTVKGINFQPVSFTGRINKEERMEKRITIPDLMYLIEEQTGGTVKADDFYPVPYVVPVSHFVNAGEDVPGVEFTVHPHCGTGTYLYVEKGRIIPISKFLDVEGLTKHVNELALNSKWMGRSVGKMKRMASLVSALPKYIDADEAPESVDMKRYLINILMSRTADAVKEFHRNTLFIGCMHFMDMYNIDLERVKRCGIHYATPDGRIIPFCTYNTVHREKVEKKFAVPLKVEAEE